MWGQLYRKVLVSAVLALVFLGFFVNLGLAEVIEKGAGVDTIPVQAPAYSAVLRDWYSEGDYVYHYSNPDGSGIFYHKEVRRELAGSNYYGSGYNIFYYVLVYPNGTEQILYEKRINTADATQSETVDMGGDYVPRTRTHSYSKIDIAAMNLTADIPDFGHYKVELRRVEIPKIMLNKNPMENYNLEDKLDKWNAEIINTLYSSSSWSDGAWWREYKDEACSTEGPVGNITLRTAVTVNSHGPNGYPTTSCSEYNMNPASGSVCKYNYYMYTEDDGPRYVNHVMTNKCWIERSGFEKVKVKDLQKGVIWTHEFDVKQPLTITGATACGDIECRTNPTFRPQEEAFFFVNVSEPAGLQMNVWKSVTAEETRDKYSDLKFGAEVKGGTEFMKITTDGVGYRRIITTDKFSYPLKIKWRGKYAFYQAGMVNLFYGDQEDFSMGNHNGDITGFYLGTFDSGAMNANYDGGVNLGQPEINKEHTYELQVLKDKLIWFLDGNKVNEKVLSSPRPASRIGIIAYGGSVEFQLKEFQIDLGDGQINGNINGGDKFLNFTANNQEALSKYSDYKFSIISEPEWGKPYVLQNGKLKLSGGTYFPTQPSPESRYDRHSCNGDPNGCGWYGSSATFRTQDKFEYPVKIKWKGTIEAGYSGLNYNNIDLSYHNKDDTGQMSRFIGFFWDGWYRRMHAVSNIIPAGQQYPPGLSFGDLSGTEHEYELDIYKDKIVWLLDGNKVMEQALSQPLDAGSVEVRAHGELRVAFSLSSLEVDKGDLVLKSDFSSPGLLRPVFEDKSYLVGMRPEYPVGADGNIKIFQFSPQEEGNYDLEFVARADEREDSYSVPVPVYYNSGITESFVSNPFVQGAGSGGTGGATTDAGSANSMLPLAAVSVAGAAGIYFVANRSQTKKVITGIKSGLTEYGNALVKRSKEILDFIQEEKNGYWVNIWEARMRAEAAMWARFNAAQAEKQKAQWFEENKQTIWAAAQANEALEMLKSGKGDPGWFVQRMQYLSESAGDRELAAQLAGMGTQVQAQLEARPAVIYTPDLTKPAAAPAKIEQKSLLDNVMGFFGNALGNAKKLVGGALDIVGKIPVVGKPIVQAVGAARDFVVEKSDFIKSLSDNAGWAGLGMMVGGGILMGAGALASATGIGAVAGVPLAAVGAGLLQGGFALGAASAVTDAGVWAAKESTGKASEDDKFSAMLAPAVLVGGGLGRGVKGWKALNNVKKPVAKVVEKVKGYSLNEIKSKILEHYKAELKQYPKLDFIRPNFGLHSKGGGRLAMTIIVNGSPRGVKFFIGDIRNEANKWGESVIKGVVSDEVMHIASAASRKEFWSGSFKFSDNVIEWIRKAESSVIGLDMEDIVNRLRTSIKHPEVIPWYKHKYGLSKPFEMAHILKNELYAKSVDLYTKNIVEARNFIVAGRKIGKLIEKSEANKKIFLGGVAGLPSLDSLSDGVKNTLWDGISQGVSLLKGQTPIKGTLGLPSDRVEKLQREIDAQRANFGVKLNGVEISDIDGTMHTLAQAGYDRVYIDRADVIDNAAFDTLLQTRAVAHEMSHLYIGQQRFANWEERAKFIEQHSGTWFDELEANAFMRGKVSEQGFKNMAIGELGDILTEVKKGDTYVDNPTPLQLEKIISAELLALRVSDKNTTGLSSALLIKVSSELSEHYIKKGVIGREQYDKTKTLLDNWLKNTIDKGKVGSEHEAAELQDNLMDILPR